MEFDAAGAIRQEYSPILGSEELASKLAARFRMFHCEENRTPENLEMEFKSLLVDLGWERKLGLLADMLGRADGKERGFVIDALREGLNKCGANGHVLEPANLLERKLPPELVKDVEDAMEAGARMARRTGNLGEAASLLERPSTPWRVVDVICRECEGTRHFTKIANIFPREGMPTDTHIIAMDAMVNSVKAIEKAVRADLRKLECAGQDKRAEEERNKARQPMGAIVYLLQKKLPDSLQVCLIKACKGCGLHKMRLVERLGKMFSRPDAKEKARAEAARALMDGEMQDCVSAGCKDQVFAIMYGENVPEEAREKAGEILRGPARAPGSGRQLAIPRTSANGFMEPDFTRPSRRVAITPAEAAPTVRVDVKPGSGRKR